MLFSACPRISYSRVLCTYFTILDSNYFYNILKQAIGKTIAFQIVPLICLFGLKNKNLSYEGLYNNLTIH